MQTAYRLLSAAALALVSASSFATVTFTTSASFLSHVGPPSYTNDFNGLTNPPPTSFSGNGLSYTITAPSDTYASGDFLGTNQSYEILTITFGSNITAVGANFYPSDFGDVFHAEAINLLLTLSDSSTQSLTFTPGSVSDSFRGFTSGLAISSLKVSVPVVPGLGLYAGLDNLTVGTAIPEPTSGLLVALGMAGLLVARRRAA